MYSKAQNEKLRCEIPLDVYGEMLKSIQSKKPLSISLPSTEIQDILIRYTNSNIIKDYNEYLLLNLASCLFTIKVLIQTGLEKTNVTLTKEIATLDRGIEKNQDEISRFENPIAGGYSVKDKKRSKKERTQILNDPNRFSKINQLESELSEFKLKKIKLSDKVLEIERNLENLSDYLENKSLTELLYILENYKTISMYPNGSSKKNNLSISNERKFSSCRVIERNKNISMFPPVPVTDVTLNTNKNIKSLKVINPEMSEFFKKLASIIKDSKLKDQEKQIEIEEFWLVLLTEKYQSPEKSLHAMHSLMSGKLKLTFETFHLMYTQGNLKKKYPFSFEYLYDLDLLLITHTLCLDSVARELGMTVVSRMVGSRLIQYLFMKYIRLNLKKLKSGERARFLDLHSQIPSEALTDIKKFQEFLHISSNEDFIRLGDFFIELFCRFPTGMFERSVVKYIEGIEYVERRLVVQEGLHEVILNNLKVSPFSLPMLSLPNKWSDTEFGGYITNKDVKNGLITGSSQHNHKMENKEALYYTINTLSGVVFRINVALLNYIENNL